jgi:L-glyceraldehyde 3-phosphate reductase
VIGFTALAQGLLTNRYLDGIPEDSRAARDPEFDKSWLNDEMIARLRALNEIASRRGQSLAQLALAWGLRDERVTSLVIGASSVDQLEQNVGALDNLAIATDELAEIDRHVTADGSVDLWQKAREGAL